VSPVENLPQQICDLCIVQLNVSYNFKRLALKNDFHMRQYLIENGMNLTKDDEDSGMESLEIHQIHNVIRTNRYRAPILASEVRRNSTTSSVSGVSTMLLNGRENNITPSNHQPDPRFAPPRPVAVRPIQIKVEPVDEEESRKEPSPSTSTSNSSPSSSVLVASSSSVSSVPPQPQPQPPMVVINGNITSNVDKTPVKSPEANQPTSPRKGRPRKDDKSPMKDLRTIKKVPDAVKRSQRLVKAVTATATRPRRQTVEKATKKVTKKRVTIKKLKKLEIVTFVDAKKKRGRPRKHPLPNAKKATNNNKTKAKKS